MRARTVAASLLTAAALAVTPLTVAVAYATPTAPDVTKSQAAKARAQARKLEKLSRAQARQRGAVVLGGRLTAVVPADPTVVGAASTLAFTVHGGRYKPLRGQAVTVAVAPDAKVTRQGVVTLAELVAGDHVVVKSRDFTFSVARSTDAATGVETVTVAATATVSRVVGSPAGSGETVVPAA